MSGWFLVVFIFFIVVVTIMAISLVLHWVGWKGVFGGTLLGLFFGALLMLVTGSLITLLLAIAIGMVLGAIWHRIFR